MLSGTAERRLLGDLLEYYQKFERPVANEADAIQLKFGLTLQWIWSISNDYADDYVYDDDDDDDDDDDTSEHDPYLMI